MRITYLALLIPLISAVTAQTVHATEAAACQTVHMSDPGWTDINATNAIAGVLLKGLGYQQTIQNLSVPVGFQGLKTGQVDVFLGNWMPAQQPILSKFTGPQGIETLTTNLGSAKFTLVVPDYVAAAGVHSFADLAKFSDRFGKKIYGIAPGSPANDNIAKMLARKDFKLDGWSLVASSETGMLTQAERAIRKKEWIVFLGWEPHVMNTHFKLVYLQDGDAYFGPNYGSATVNTLTRAHYAKACPNVARLFQNLSFTVDQENQIIQRILDQKQSPATAAIAVLQSQPQAIRHWLSGVTTVDGHDGLTAVNQSLGLK